MPAALERALRRSARQRGIDPDSPRGRAYVYGTLRKIDAAKAARRKAAERKRAKGARARKRRH